MSVLVELEESVKRLSPAERTAFRSWFAAFDAEEWDRQFESDVKSGRLDWLKAEAVEAVRTGLATPR